MTRNCISILILVTMAAGSHAFVTAGPRRPTFALASSSATTYRNDVPFFADVRDKATQTRVTSAKKASPAPKVATSGGAIHKAGVLSPVVLLSKKVLGEEKLNKVRAKIISMHSDVIAGFVDTSETVVGNIVLKQLFDITDANRSGTIDEEELKLALKTLGFDWLKEKQVKGIFERADSDANGAIDMDEWLKEAPKTLRTNLIKLAKKNGGDMGLLA